MTRKRRGLPGVAFVDFLSNVLMLFLVMFVLAFLLAKAEGKPHIETLGVYAVEIRWPDVSADDVDLWVQAPDGTLVYFARKDVGLMHLEHDDLGVVSDTQAGVTVRRNRERVVIRGTLVGEYVANVVMYRHDDRSATPVLVTLNRLRGDDSVVASQRLVLRRTGEEQTAFRFTLDAKQDVTDVARLPKKLGTA